MVPFRPHFALHVSLKGGLQQVRLPSLNNIDPVPPSFGPRRAWEHFATTDGSFKILGCVAKTKEQQAISEEFSQWTRQAEGYLLDVAVEPVAKGRGTVLEYGSRPQVESNLARAKWDSSDLNYWCGLQRLVGDLTLPGRPVAARLKRQLHQVLEEQAALLSKHWWPEFDDSCAVEGMRYMVLSFQRVDGLYGSIILNCLKRFVGHLIDQRRAFYRKKFEDSLLTPKQMHAYLKKEQETFVRPIQNIPFEQRPEGRRKYWAKIWGDSPDGACYEEWPEWNEIVELGRTQLSNEKAISSTQLRHMLTQYPSKRGGLDGWSVKELKALPKEALSAWAYMYRKIQQEFQWPVALTVVGYALLPKSEEAERPIALTSLRYRLLIKSRLHLLEAWLQKVAALCPWDRAVAGSTVFCSSVARMLRAEILPHAKLYQASVLVDLKHCYDRMNIQLLIRAALKRKYPPGLLALAVPVHCGVRVLMAENMHSQCIQPVRGILAGCSLSVSLAKLYLWDMMEALQLSPGLVASDTWVDDLSFDLVDYNPDRLALRALALYEDLAGRVAELELQISVKKSGFLVSHVAVAQPLKTLLQAARTKRGFEYPQVCTALKDLGVQTTLARCRRVGVQKARLGKGLQRASRLSSIFAWKEERAI